MEDPGVVEIVCSVIGALIACYIIWRVGRFLSKVEKHIEKHIDDNDRSKPPK